MHIHTKEDEVFYVLDGALTYQVGDRKVEATAGSLLYVPKGILHGFSNLCSTPAKVLVFIAPAGFEKFFEEIGEPAKALTLSPKTFAPPDLDRITAVAKKYGTEVKGPPPGR
ncbi:MAG: cupin domain-containing protein [Dehalococcoidia bacterium]|nr:cupin domain-containing protein [Dehalococcoidia bacterium]